MGVIVTLRRAVSVEWWIWKPLEWIQERMVGEGEGTWLWLILSFFFWSFLEVVLQRGMKKWWRSWRALWVWRKTFVVFITVVFNGRCYTMSLRWLLGKKAPWGNRDKSQLQEFYLWEEREWDPVYKWGRRVGVVLALGAKGSLLHLTRGKSTGELADLVRELVEALFRVLLFSRWNKM